MSIGHFYNEYIYGMYLYSKSTVDKRIEHAFILSQVYTILRV